MREVSKLEGEHISGGKIPVVDLPPVVVSPSPPPSGTGGGGIGLWGGGLGGPAPSPPPSGVGIGVGGGGGGTGSHGLTKEQLFEIDKGLAEELQALALHGDVPSDWIVTGVDLGKMTMNAGDANYNEGKTSWNLYKDTDHGVNPIGAYINGPINWNTFDWSQIPGARDAATYDDAMQDAFNYMHTLELKDGA